MALDGLFLSTIKTQLSRELTGCRIDKIFMPSKEEIVMTVRTREGAQKLLMSSAANAARVHFTKASFENPKNPPMFCMLLRKKLVGSKVTGIRQHSTDRILFIDFEGVNELYDKEYLTIAAEIMGRHSNIILFDAPTGRVIDSIKRVSLEMSGERPILPGIVYSLPPMQNKYSVTDLEPDELARMIRANYPDDLPKAIMSVVLGVSPILAREVAFYAGTDDNRLRFALGRLKDLSNGNGEFGGTVVCDCDRSPKDFSLINITHYGAGVLTRRYDSPSALLDEFYSDRVTTEKFRQLSQDILKLLANAEGRVRRRLQAQQNELLESENKELLKIKADILSANLYTLKEGQESVTLLNFYDNDASLQIDLDAAKTPVENIAKYYADYKKTVTASRVLAEQITAGERELAYLESVFDLLSRASSTADIDGVREELMMSGYLRRRRDAKSAAVKLPHLKYTSSDGFTILVGRNNLGNDKLTLKESGKNDIWLHAQKIPGSHTVIKTEGRDVTDHTIEEAAIIAATHSKARNSSKVPVDYTLIKHVRKPKDAPFGFVVYDNYKTAFVTPPHKEWN